MALDWELSLQRAPRQAPRGESSTNLGVAPNFFIHHSSPQLGSANTAFCQKGSFSLWLFHQLILFSLSWNLNYFHSNLLFFHVEKHLLKYMYIYIHIFLSKSGKFIFCQEKRQWIIVQNSSANPCKTHGTTCTSPAMHIPVFLETTSSGKQSHSARRWSCSLLVCLQLRHLFVFGRSCFFLWKVPSR